MGTFDFPQDFLWGAATASYQIEGAVDDDGRGKTVWDTYCETPGKVANGESGAVACDHYHRYPEDAEIMSKVGLKAYRFSIAWSRLLPNGFGEPNKKGIEFYSRLVDVLLEKGIQPCPTLFHWDYPQALEDIGGWSHPDAAKWFGDYAELCFRSLGDRVKFWITHNEPWCYSFLGHEAGIQAPGLKDQKKAFEVAHGMLLGHGEAVSRYRALNQAGKIGMTTNHAYFLPENPESELDRKAAGQCNDWMNGWFLDPVYFGDYPEFLKQAYPVPEFTPEQSKSVSQKTDFMGLNFYSASRVRFDENGGPNQAKTVHRDDVPQTDMGWPVVPDTLRETLVYSQQRWNPDEIYITENGCAYDYPVEADGVHDLKRMAFLRDYIAAARRSMDDGVKLKGYFVWSLLDNFEWSYGYSKRFGIVHVDYQTQKRTIKDSALMYRDIIQSNSLSPAYSKG